MADWNIERESKELIGPIEVRSDGVLIDDFEVALLPGRQRPVEADWTATIVAVKDGVEGRYLLAGPGTDRVLAPGLHAMWARYASNPELPVIGPFAQVLVD